MRTLILVEWLCTKERLNERGPYTLVEWSCVNMRNKSVETINSARIVMHIASAKITEREQSISPFSFYGQLLDSSVCNFQSMNSPVELNSLSSKFFCYITRFVTSPAQTRERTTCKRGLYVKQCCFSETVAYGLKITNCISHRFSVLSIQSMSFS